MQLQAYIIVQFFCGKVLSYTTFQNIDLLF